MLTQSQTTSTVETDVPVMYSCPSICKWAGATGIEFLDGDKALPYVEKNGIWYYFGKYEDEVGKREYRLICTATKDLGRKED